ncbi:MAG: phosphofructokinase [Hamadaea sp.]|nr:phosphofructokinase [Hamadaea sp.]NUR49037.1 phosphofructokinase [Hamadaea sp.]NUT08698.1 phosphofructokinase [Hamadaea sp.]
MVFAPAPQLTVTVERPSRGGTDEIHLHAGGQGVWQARMIASLGAQVVFCTALGGEAGQVLSTLIESEGIEPRVVETNSATGAYVHDRRGGERREVAVMPGEALGRHEQDELYGLALSEGLRSQVSVLSGMAETQVLPPDIYRRLAGDLRRNGGTVVADLSGAYLDAVLEGGLALAKVSHEELVRDGRAPTERTADLISAMRRLRDGGARAVVATRAEKPALALLPDPEDTIVEVRMPELEPADHHGAGDSMTAGIATVLAQGGDLPAAVRLGAAAGALNVTRHGLGTGRADAIARLVERVSLRAYEGEPMPPMDGHATPDELAHRTQPGGPA